MDIYTIVGLALATAIAAFTVREYNKQAAVHISIAGGAVIMLAILAQLSGVIDELHRIAQSGNIQSQTFSVMLKAVGIAYIVQLASGLCRDLGESALAVKAEIAGRVMLLTLALPIIKDIAAMLIKLIGSSI